MPRSTHTGNELLAIGHLLCVMFALLTMASALPGFVWIDGRIMSAAHACISPFDHGLLVGDGAFETLISYAGTPFAETRHWERLRFSCETLGIAVPSAEVIAKGMREVMAANERPDARLRVTVTSGEGPLGSDKGSHAPTVIIACSALKPWPETEALITVPWPRNERSALAGVKSISYAENVRALAFAKNRRGGEALFANTRGELCEGTGSNIFLVAGETVVTPPLSSGCLAGVTRGLVIELCRSDGIALTERPILMGEIEEYPEAFITSTTREVQAIARIDDRQLPLPTGPITKRLRALFKELAAASLDP